LRLAGEFDLAGKKEFQARLSEVTLATLREVIVDLRDVDYIDSTGLGLILEAWNLARRRGLDFAVLLTDGQVRRVFRESGLDQALPIIAGLPAVEYKDAGTGSGNGLRSTSRS
jgi:anti-sigma B factor antagonist